MLDSTPQTPGLVRPPRFVNVTQGPGEEVSELPISHLD